MLATIALLDSPPARSALSAPGADASASTGAVGTGARPLAVCGPVCGRMGFGGVAARGVDLEAGGTVAALRTAPAGARTGATAATGGTTTGATAGATEAGAETGALADDASATAVVAAVASTGAGADSPSGCATPGGGVASGGEAPPASNCAGSPSRPEKAPPSTNARTAAIPPSQTIRRRRVFADGATALARKISCATWLFATGDGTACGGACGGDGAGGASLTTCMAGSIPACRGMDGVLLAGTKTGAAGAGGGTGAGTGANSGAGGTCAATAGTGGGTDSTARAGSGAADAASFSTVRAQLSGALGASRTGCGASGDSSGDSSGGCGAGDGGAACSSGSGNTGAGTSGTAAGSASQCKGSTGCDGGAPAAAAALCFSLLARFRASNSRLMIGAGVEVRAASGPRGRPWRRAPLAPWCGSL